MDPTVDTQAVWDTEEAVGRLRRIHHLHAAVSAAALARSAARSEYARAIQAEKNARNELTAYLEADTRPLPLFDHMDSQEAELSAETLGEAREKHDCDENWTLPPYKSPPPATEDEPAEVPWPSCLERSRVKGAYIGDRFQGNRKKPITVIAFLWQGKFWANIGSAGTAARCVYEVVPLIPLAEFQERFPGIAVKLAPSVPANATEEDRMQYYTGVRVRVGKEEYVIAPAGETRRICWTQED